MKVKTYSSINSLQLENTLSGNDCSLLKDKSLQENKGSSV